VTWCPAIVRWLDAHDDAHTWTPIDELDTEPRLIETCGWLLDDVTPGHLVVALSVDGDRVGSVIHIPECNVQEVQRWPNFRTPASSSVM
jgi:hypothetical protein